MVDVQKFDQVKLFQKFSELRTIFQGNCDFVFQKIKSEHGFKSVPLLQLLKNSNL